MLSNFRECLLDIRDRGKARLPSEPFCIRRPRRGRHTFQIRAVQLALAGLFCLFSLSVSATDLKLWYESPASEWIYSLPIGNGRLLATNQGGVRHEIIQLNEEIMDRRQIGDRATLLFSINEPWNEDYDTLVVSAWIEVFKPKPE